MDGLMNDKEIIKKLLKIASNQQKIITKIAQQLESEDQKKARWEAERSKLTLEGDFLYGSLSADNPYRYDPLYAGIKGNPSGNSAAPDVSHIAQTPAAPAAKPSSAPQIYTQMQPSTLSPDLLALLTTSVPELKGALVVKQRGKFLDVDYNADLVRGKLNLSASDVKRLVSDAVKGRFEVDKVVGHSNPDKTFKVNFV